MLELSRTTRGRVLLQRHALLIQELRSEATEVLVKRGVLRREGERLLIALHGPALSWELDAVAANYRSDILNEPAYATIEEVYEEEFLDEVIQDGYEVREWLRPVLAAVVPNESRFTPWNVVDNLPPFDSWLFEKAVVSIPRYHVRGELERPFEERLFGWRIGEKRESHFSIESLDTLSSADFFGHVYGSAADRRVLVFVHGFATSRDVAIMRAGQLAFDARFTGTTVAFVWPSLGKIDPVSYRRDRTVMSSAAVALAQLLRELQRPGYEICVFGHSLGCAVITEALRLGASVTMPFRLSEVIYGAPDVGATELQAVMPIIRCAVQRLTIYTSWRDVALYLSAGINRRLPIGLGQPRTFVINGSESIDATRVWHQFLRLDHGYVFGSSRLLGDIRLALQGEPQTRYELRKVARVRRWEFVPIKS